MFFSLFKPQKTSEPKSEKYNPFKPLEYFPEGLIIQTPEKTRYSLNPRGYLNFRSWGLINENSENEQKENLEEAKFGFVESELEHLVNGEIAAIGTLPLEIGEKADENIANTIGEKNSSRMEHYYQKITQKLKQYGQNPKDNPLHPLIILYSEKAAIENRRLGIYFSKGKWQLVNSEP